MTGSKVGKWMLGAFIACMAACGVPAVAQSTFGSVLGTVKDQSGSVVPGATLTLLNVGSAAKRTETSSASGNYEFLSLDAGTYQLTIVASGFKDAVFNHIVLQARDTQRIEASLAIG